MTATEIASPNAELAAPSQEQTDRDWGVTSIDFSAAYEWRLADGVWAVLEFSEPSGRYVWILRRDGWKTVAQVAELRLYEWQFSKSELQELIEVGTAARLAEESRNCQIEIELIVGHQYKFDYGNKKFNGYLLDGQKVEFLGFDSDGNARVRWDDVSCHWKKDGIAVDPKHLMPLNDSPKAIAADESDPDLEGEEWGELVDSEESSSSGNKKTRQNSKRKSNK